MSQTEISETGREIKSVKTSNKNIDLIVDKWKQYIDIFYKEVIPKSGPGQIRYADVEEYIYHTIPRKSHHGSYYK